MEKIVSIQKSAINGRGIFARKNFKKGEIVLNWNPKWIGKVGAKKLSKIQQKYIIIIGKKYYLMQVPEKYVNHSCNANTKVVGKSDIAKRDIKIGEEITSDYSGKGMDSFLCNCGSKDCRSKIN